MLVRGLDLGEHVALLLLDLRELGDQVLLEGTGPVQLHMEALDSLEALGPSSDSARALSHNAVSFRSCSASCLRRAAAPHGRAGAPELFLEHREAADRRLQLAARSVDRRELLLRVGHLRRQAIAQHVEALQLRPARELVAQPAVDVGAQGVERVQPALQLLDDLRSGFEGCQPAGKFVDGVGDALCLRGARFCCDNLGRQGVDLRLDGEACPMKLLVLSREARAFLVGAKLVEERRRLLVGAVNRLDFGLERVEILALLAQAVELPLGTLGRLEAVEPLLERGERVCFRCSESAMRSNPPRPSPAPGCAHERSQILIPCRDRLHTGLGLGNAGLSDPQPFVDGLDLLPVHRELIHVTLHGFHQGPCIVLLPGHVAAEGLAGARGLLELLLVSVWMRSSSPIVSSTRARVSFLRPAS